MDINCAVTCDLLPLYLEGLCSQETKALVEAHLASCQDCRDKLRRMSAEPIPEAAAPVVEQADGRKLLNAKKVLKRLRRRWLALLLCALLLVPVTLLSVNQANGTGLSFTAIPYVMKTHSFLSAVSSGEYERAFAMVDVAREYDGYAIPTYASFAAHPLAQYQEVQIGGDSYYVSDSVYLNDYANYLRDGDEAQFWLGMLLFHESIHDPSVLIPEQAMHAIEERIKNDEDLFKTLGYFLSGFSPVEGPAGRYYMSREIPEEELTCSDPHFSVLPAAYYRQSVQRAQREIEEMNNYSARYAALGLETYTELSQTTFTENLENLARKGVAITGWRLADIYVMEGGIYHITYALKLTVNGQPVTGSSLELSIGKNGVISSSFQESHSLTIREDAAPDLPEIRLIRLYFLEWAE